jgi:histidinol-phosphate aminotransferase
MELNNTILLINERIRDLKKYHLEPEETTIKLNQNENPYDWPEAIKEEIAAFCKQRPLNRYPNFVPDGLKQKLSEYTGVPANGILIGNGSNEMLLVLLLALAGPDRKVVLCQPTFTVYRLLATGVGAKETSILLNNDFSFNVPAICTEIEKNPESLLVLCSPNNPTGSSLTHKDLETILAVHKGFVILDQAYVEFGGYNAIPLLKNNPNLIITRTFSKAFAGAGLRLGYMLGSPEIITHINKIKLPYNINFFSEHVAGVMLAHRSEMQPVIERIVSEKKSVIDRFKAMPFAKVYNSDANFICVRLAKKQELFDYLKTKGILVRDVSSYPLCDGCLRINIGTPEENKVLVDAVQEFFTNV